MNYYKIPAEQLEQNLNDVLKMTGDTFSQHDAKLPVSRSFSSEELHGIWQFADAQRKIIVQKHETSSNNVEMMCLAFAANCIADIMDEIAELLEPSENCG